MRRGGGPQHLSAPLPITSTGKPFPISAQDALTMISKHVRLSGHHRSRNLSQISEWQPLLDNDVFCLTPDRRSTRLTLLQQFNLLEVLAQFFSEKADDPNKCAYFEAIFLGRENDSCIHEHRIDILFKLASYALQFPVLQLFPLMMQWLTKLSPSAQRPYAENLVRLLTDHYVRPDTSRRMYEFLLPLEADCKDFTVYFLAYAHRYCDVMAPFGILVSSYILSNTPYVLNSFRDYPLMAKEFANEVFPKCLIYCMEHPDKDEEVIQSLISAITSILYGWKNRVKDIELNYEPLTSEEFPWNICKFSLINLVLSHANTNQYARKKLEEQLSRLNVPRDFRTATQVS